MSKMGCRILKAIDIPNDKILASPVKRDFHGGRSGRAYMVHDLASRSLLLSSKLTSIAAHLNENYVRNKYELVSPRGLYESAISKSQFPHKMRFRVYVCDLKTAHLAFQTLRESDLIERSILLTEGK